MGRYPMHFHLMGESGSRSYLTDCSIHRSYYRAVSLHGTHRATLSQNVAYDITGHAFYLEDGVEERNRIEFNLAAHVHVIGTPASSSGQQCEDVDSSEDLLLPADVTASGFYISNAHNDIVGNAASGGWAGFALPNLPSPVMHHRNLVHDDSSLVPSARATLKFNGNSAHSAGYYWFSAGQVYVGGKLWHPHAGSDLLRYNPCRTEGRRGRTTMNECERRCQTRPSL